MLGKAFAFSEKIDIRRTSRYFLNKLIITYINMINNGFHLIGKPHYSIR